MRTRSGAADGAGRGRAYADDQHEPDEEEWQAREHPAGTEAEHLGEPPVPNEPHRKARDAAAEHHQRHTDHDRCLGLMRADAETAVLAEAGTAAYFESSGDR